MSTFHTKQVLTEFYFSVTASTTHVISGEGKRTLNLLKGLMQVSQFFKLSIFSNVWLCILSPYLDTDAEQIQGCWLLTKEWAYSSLEEGRWAPEEPFEMVNFSPAVSFWWT